MDNSIFKSKHYLAVLVASVVAIAMMFMFHDKARYITTQGEVWTTAYHITYENKAALDDSIKAVFMSVDTSASVYNPASVVSKINKNVSCVPDGIFSQLYQASLDIYRQSEGAFDPTVMPLVNAWGFGYKNGRLPGKEQIDSILQFVGLSKTKLEHGKIVKEDSRTQFDFSSIAKGLACDEVGRMLSRQGVKNYMVEIGGELVCRGHNENGDIWHVSVDMPISQEGSAAIHESVLVLALDCGAVATSGNYRKYKDVSGDKRVSHIVNPLTGESQTSDLLSVTIVAADCMTADAWATACMVLGTQRVKGMMANRSDLGVMTISTDADGNLVVWSNKRFADLVVL